MRDIRHRWVAMEFVLGVELGNGHHELVEQSPALAKLWEVAKTNEHLEERLRAPPATKICREPTSQEGEEEAKEVEVE